jgi:hypothetical protein
MSEVVRRTVWALRTAWHAEPKTFAARLRLLWHDFVIHGLLNRGHERCQDCGRPTKDWHTSNDRWRKVVGSPSGLLCEPCFKVRGVEVPDFWGNRPEGRTGSRLFPGLSRFARCS